MKRRSEKIAPRGQNLKGIEFSTSTGPAGTCCVTVLQRPRDLSVQEPCRGHIDVEAGSSVSGHRKVHEEKGVAAGGETAVGGGAWTNVAAVAAGCAAENGEFVVGGDQDVTEGLRGLGGGDTVCVGEGETVAET